MTVPTTTEKFDTIIGVNFSPSGNPHEVTDQHATPTLVTYNLDGSNDYIDKDGGTTEYYKSGSIGSMGLWIRARANNVVIIQERPSTTGWFAALDPSGRLQVRLADDNSNYLESIGTTNLADDEWHYIHWVVRSTTNLDLYVDKVEETYTTDSVSTGTGWSGFTDDSATMRIGANPSAGQLFEGLVSRISIWATTALSTAELQEDYDNEVAAYIDDILGHETNMYQFNEEDQVTDVLLDDYGDEDTSDVLNDPSFKGDSVFFNEGLSDNDSAEWDEPARPLIIESDHTGYIAFRLGANNVSSDNSRIFIAKNGLAADREGPFIIYLSGTKTLQVRIHNDTGFAETTPAISPDITIDDFIILVWSYNHTTKTLLSHVVTSGGFGQGDSDIGTVNPEWQGKGSDGYFLAKKAAPVDHYEIDYYQMGFINGEAKDASTIQTTANLLLSQLSSAVSDHCAIYPPIPSRVMDAIMPTICNT